MIEKVSSFLNEFKFEDIPKVAIDNSLRSFVDLIGVAASATQTDLSKIIRKHCKKFYAPNLNQGISSSIWFDGSNVNVLGATLANSMTIDSLDAHDGQKLTKGHVGCGLIPSIIACMEAEENYCSKDLLRNLVIGYEIGTRAGISLHKSSKDYHTSGAWIAIACAGIVSKILELNKNQIREAFGIAEFYGPRSQMMRCIDYPTMVKDGSGWGAMSGVNAAYLAKEGFSGSPAITVEDESLSYIWSDLGSKWYTNEQYLKLYPVCRWAQPALEACLYLKRKHNIDVNNIESITINTFHEAKRLDNKYPENTEQAQYSLPYPVAVALIFERLSAQEVSEKFFKNKKVIKLTEKILVCESDNYNKAFPKRRYADAVIKLKNGNEFKSKPTEAKGDPENPLLMREIKNKFEDLTFNLLGKDRSERLFKKIIELNYSNDFKEVLELIIGSVDK